MNISISHPRRPYIPYVVPFALFAICIYIPSLFNVSQGLISPVKTVLVAASLIYFWNVYKQEIRFSFNWLAVISGIFVFFIWVLPEGLYPQIGHSEFNPYEHASGYVVCFVVAFRLICATLVVPLTPIFALQDHIISSSLELLDWSQIIQDIKGLLD